MTLFRQKTRKVEAWKVTDETVANELWRMLIGDGQSPTIEGTVGEHFHLYFPTGNKEHDLQRGDWLIKINEDPPTYDSRTDHEFQIEFEAAAESENDFHPYLGPNRCRFYNQNTDTVYTAHGEVMVEADNNDDFEPSWLGPTPNPYHYGYCSRCGQPFVWLVPDYGRNLDPTFHGFVEHDNPENEMGWVETSREAIKAEYEKFIADGKARVAKTVRERRRGL